MRLGSLLGRLSLPSEAIVSTTAKVGKRALLAAAARDDARAEVTLARGKSAKRYDGNAPNDAFSAREVGGLGRSRLGRSVRAGRKGGLKLVPPRFDGDAPKGGGARLAAGEWLVVGVTPEGDSGVYVATANAPRTREGNRDGYRKTDIRDNGSGVAVVRDFHAIGGNKTSD